MMSSMLLPLSLIILAGMPHGAADGALALIKYDDLIKKLLFFTAYISLAIMGFILWTLAPTLSLLIFLFITVQHFGAGDIKYYQYSSVPIYSKYVHGSSILIFMSIGHPAEMQSLVSLLIAPEHAEQVINGLTWSAIAWSIAVLSLLFKVQQRRKLAIELMLIVSVAMLLPPLWSFCFYFCVIHSLRHFRLIFPTLRRSAVSIYLTACFAVMGIGLVALLLITDITAQFDQALFRSSIIALFMLTLPHMIFIDYLKPIKEIR